LATVVGETAVVVVMEGAIAGEEIAAGMVTPAPEAKRIRVASAANPGPVAMPGRARLGLVQAEEPRGAQVARVVKVAEPEVPVAKAAQAGRAEAAGKAPEEVSAVVPEAARVVRVARQGPAPAAFLKARQVLHQAA